MKARYTQEQLEEIMRIKKQYDSTDRDFSTEDESPLLEAEAFKKLIKKKKSKSNTRNNN